MRNQILIAMLLGVLIWCGIATNVTPPRTTADIYRPAPPAVQKAALQISCAERAEICKTRSRLEKVREKVKEELKR